MTSTQAFFPSSQIPIPASARAVLRLLERLRHGALHVQFPDGRRQRFGAIGSAALAGQPDATLVMHNWNVCGAALKSGDIGFAESFIAGDWSTPNLTELLKLFVANRRDIDEMIHGSWAGRLLYRFKHLLNHNSKRNSRKNIQAHYDLGNAFYRLWLDETMNYSSAWFQGDFEKPLHLAQTAKVQRALRQVGAKPGDRILEIGCGWGALAQSAIEDFSANLVGVTLSTEQLDFARARLASVAGNPLAAADLRLQDYRDISDAPFDGICSIEMVEAVGQSYWPQYFQTVSRLLKPGARACIQSIVIDDNLFDRYAKSTDFIQQYIFPGGCLPSSREFRKQAHLAGLHVVDEFLFGADYAETLRRWRAAFLANLQAVAVLGFDQRFIRIWEFYLCYCEAAFDGGDIDVVQFTLQKPSV
jgi:cyclopropane-fatty-acyl-phospholipid synthase